MEAAVCSVCLEALGPQLAVCREGHGVCRPCGARLRLCPICKAPFSTHRHTLLAQLLDILPHQCPNKGCPQFVRAGDNHNSVCGFAHTICKKCDWVGSGNMLLDHVQGKHPRLHIFRENNYCRLTDFNSEEEMCDFAPVYAFGQFYWAECSIDLKRRCFVMKYHFVRTGKPEKATYVVVQMNNLKLQILYKLTCCFDKKNKLEENSILIGLSTLEGFIDKKNSLTYKVDFYQGKINDKTLL